jgi:dienelactone hydrolase
MSVPQRPIPPTVDLRDMLRQHLIARGREMMTRAAARRRAALESDDLAAYRDAIRATVRGFYGALPVGASAPPPLARAVSRFDKDGYRLENVLFESFPGWEVNATVYVPTAYVPPFPAVIIPVGHSGKQFASYQLPAQLFARCGYLAVLFDPPGQAGEKQPGNDHFVDGVRCYLVGETSSRYFVGDALRCIDYLETRADVDLSRGVAMTGVSGGGTTTTLATLLDPRIAVAGPSCCLSPLAALDITQCYAGCPETHMAGRYAAGIDEVDLLCAAFPTPILLMAGERDEVFHIADTRRLAEEAAAFYARAGAAERFAFFVDAGGHAYSLAQARQFVRFLDRWLRGEPDRPLPDWPDATFTLDPYDELRCWPRQDVHMRALTAARAQELEAKRAAARRSPARVRQAARERVGPSPAAPQAVAGEPFPVWTHVWRSLLLRPEPGIELPATFLYPARGAAPALLYLDDRGRHAALYRQGPLAQAIGFLDGDRRGLAALTVDLRGWGDSAPAMYPYEMAGWGGLDRYVAYASAALGDPAMAMRTRDALAALAYLRTRPEATDRIIVCGRGLGGIVALHVAACDERVHGVIVWEGLVSFRSLLEAEAYPWPADAFWPGVLLHYDLPELAEALLCPAHILSPRDGAGRPLAEAELARLNRSAKVIYSQGSDAAALAETVAALLV